MGLYLRVPTAITTGWRLVSTDSDILFRSSNKMPMAVRAAIKNAAMKIGGISDEEAIDFMYSMEQSGRLFEETWS